MTVTVTKPSINMREALKRGVSMYGLQIATALQGGALNDVSIGGRTPAAGAFTSLSSSSDGDSVLIGSNNNVAAYVYVQGGRAYFGYDGSHARIQSTTGKGIIFAPNSPIAGTGESMRIDSVGNVGIGTSGDPTYGLELSRAGSAIAALVAGNTNLSALYFGDTDVINVGRIIYDHSDDSLQLFTNGSEKQRVDTNGALLHGTTVAGSAGAGDIVVNGGIFLGGSAAANELNDYEEGTWTPVLSDGTNADATYTIQIGHYTKIGNKVHVQGRINTSALGTISGALRITGLPFTSHNVANGLGSVLFGHGGGLSLGAGDSVSGYIPVNDSHIRLTAWNATVGSLSMVDTDFTADGDVVFSAEYTAA